MTAGVSIIFKSNLFVIALLSLICDIYQKFYSGKMSDVCSLQGFISNGMISISLLLISRNFSTIKSCLHSSKND
jgi:hypothetical protein